MGSSIADDWTECVNANEMCSERIWMDLWKNQMVYPIVFAKTQTQLQ